MTLNMLLMEPMVIGLALAAEGIAGAFRI